MDNLEQYIREQASAFDTATPPAGAEGRFLDRAEILPDGRLHFHATVRALRWAIPAAAAILVAVIFASRPTDWFRGVGQDPAAIYARYLAQVEDSWQELAADEAAADLLRNLTEESIPLIDQLPDELPDAEKAAILEDYYGALLDGAQKIRQNIK